VTIKITIYNDGVRDAQIVVLNAITNKPVKHYPLVGGVRENEPTTIEMGNGDMILIVGADDAGDSDGK